MKKIAEINDNYNNKSLIYNHYKNYLANSWLISSNISQKSKPLCCLLKSKFYDHPIKSLLFEKVPSDCEYLEEIIIILLFCKKCRSNLQKL